MLSPQSAPVVRATLPAVRNALDEVAERFYAGMFADRPELLRDLFNRGNQANGAQRRALAGSVVHFAGALTGEPGTRPDVLLERIAHRHAALGVTSEQYKLVQRYLFGALAEVLGDAVTPEVAAAWDEVYWLMANALIAREARLYQEAGVAEGDIWRAMRVTGRTEEAPGVVSFTLTRADGGPNGPFLPGQFVSVRSELPDGARQIRQYSLSAGPHREEWRITVKRAGGGPAGEGGDAAVDPEGEVSHWLHARVRPGDLLTVSAPFGGVALDTGGQDGADSSGDGPLLLVSAGIGCTPMVSMLDHLAASGSRRRVIVVHADRSPAHHAHHAELDRLVGELPGAEAHLWYEEAHAAVPGARAGRADLGALELPEGLTAYVCGPSPFLRAVRGDLLRGGVPAADIRYEIFGPDQSPGAHPDADVPSPEADARGTGE
ncbi:globin domain-containing protein [Streptomyces sp. ODS28]|uniref:globin domain-containing protein n=1 Tax=Streptomyces sp. ODS28 TaxID=3136688 RepID=UPI0031E9DD0A